MKIDTYKTTNELVKHSIVIENIAQINDVLQNGSSFWAQIKIGWRTGTLTPFEVISMVLTNWVEREKEASVETLCNILRNELGFVLAAERLEEIFLKERLEEICLKNIAQPQTLSKVKRKSEVNIVNIKSIEIDDDNWAVSLINIKGMSTHFFIILEAKYPNGSVETHFMDFVAASTLKALTPGLYQGKIRHFKFQGGLDDVLLYNTQERPKDNMRLMIIKREDVLEGFTRNLRKEFGEKLLKSVVKDLKEKNSPQYNMFGRESDLNSFPSSVTGDNCFSWAKNKLLSLGDVNETGLEDLPKTEDVINKYIEYPPSHLRTKLTLHRNLMLDKALQWLISNKLHIFMGLIIIYLYFFKG